jgi:hypothetical protein
MAETLRHRQTKEAATDMFSLQPPRHIPTLPDLATEFVAATEELASIADAGEAWRGPRRSATSPRRQVLPNDRAPRLTGAAPAPGHGRHYPPHAARRHQQFIGDECVLRLLSHCRQRRTIH